MQRITSADNLFHNGDPATSTQGTLVTDDWLNAVQEELANAVEALGGTLDNLDNGQLAALLIDSFANINGNASQVFRASQAIDPNDVVPLTQMQSLLAACFTKTYLGTYTRDISIAGSQVISGVGFTPKLAIILVAGNTSQAMSVGIDVAGSAGCIDSSSAGTVGTFNFQHTSVLLLTAVNNYAQASFASFDADGGTLNWGLTGSPTGTFTLKILFIG